MESAEREPEPKLQLEAIFNQINENQMLLFTKRGYRLYEYFETGEPQPRQVDFEGSQYLIVVSQGEPLLIRESNSLDGLVTEPSDNKADKEIPFSFLASTIETEDFKAWREGLISPDDIENAATKELIRRQKQGDEDMIACWNCKGLMHSGRCSFCENTGKAAKYPSIIIMNKLTGDLRVLRLDLADLVSKGEVEVSWGGYEKAYQDHYHLSEKMIRFNVSAYIDRHLTEMGIDIANSALVNGTSVDKIPIDKADVTGVRAYRRRQRDKITTRFAYNQNKHSAADILNNAQMNLSRIFAQPYRKIRDSGGVAIGEEWTIQPLRSVEVAFHDLKTAVENYGLYLGFARGYLSTGESGPSFYLLDSAGNTLLQLSGNYHIREALEEAWLALQKIDKDLPDFK